MRSSIRLALGLALALVACSPEPPPPTASFSDGDVMPDFALGDRNPASQSFGDSISVRSQLGAISAWYFSSAS